MRSQKKEDLIDMSFNTIAVPFAILSVLSVFLSSVKFSEEEVVSQGEWAIEKLEIESILSGKEPIYGSPSAPYSVIEFADYQCPHCARTTPSIKKLITAHAKLINLKYKHYPLSNTCNHNISSKGHALACEAAYAANCAGKQQKFWQLSKLLFINGSYLEDNSFDLLAQQLQLNTADFSACMQNPSTKEEVLQDIKAADIAKIQGTPALFLHDGENWWKIQEHDKGLKKVLLLLAQGETPPHGKTNPFQPQNLDPSNSQPKED